MVDHQHGEQVFGQTALGEDLRDLEPAAGAVGRVLQQHAIAGHQVGDCVADHLIGGEVPRLDAVDHADGRVGYDATPGIVRVARLVGQFLGAVGGGVVADRGAQLHLVAARADQLADFGGHQLGELFLVVTQCLAEALEDFGALFEAAQFPVFERLVAGIDLGEGFVLREVRIAVDLLAGRGVDGRNLGHWG